MMFRSVLAGLAVGLALALPAHAAADWPAVAKALGKEGSVQAGGVYRVGLPRTDLHVTLDGVAIKPTLALGSWVAFKDEGDHAMAMGDLVLLPSEVNPVLSALEAGGINVTAIHNHLLRASPMTFYLHIDGHGDAVKMAGAIHAALARSKTPMGASPPPAKPEPMNLDTARLDQIIGAKGKAAGGVWQYGVPRAEPVRAGGMELNGPLGAAESLNFQGLPGGMAATTGDFVLTADEVNPVIQALRAHGIEVTALHNHMLDDEPRLFFMHFWAKGNAATLAQGLRAALDRVKTAHQP